jgi:gliding motility-associated-like protein
VRLYKLFLFPFLFTLLFCESAQASHIRAGDLVIERIDTGNPNALLYKITVNLYRDVAGVAAQPGEINFGDGTDPVTVAPEDLGLTPDGLTQKLRYVVEHSFQNNGDFKISYFERNRNGGIANISNSLEVPFYIESQIRVNPGFGLNATPILEIPPLDQACTGQKFTHNPGAFDEQGDSLAYELTVSRQGSGIPVPNYRFPDELSSAQEDGSTPDLFFIDSQTGTLTWNAPETAGEYNVAFFINEWRDGRNISKINRDMQITVRTCNNERPNIDPKDTCIVAGMILKGIIEATDKDDDAIILTQEKAIPSNFVTPNSSFTILENRAGFTSGEFKWESRCEDVREEPYQAVFKVKEKRTDGEVELSEFEVWRVKVVGPAPTGLDTSSVDQIARTISLKWDGYTCQDDAQVMQIWRRRGSFDFALDTCEPGIPDGSGYELIDEVDILQTNYFDNNKGAGLERGTRYCYRLVARFPEPKGGESLASFETCAFIESFAPYIMNVSVIKTNEKNATDGADSIVWTRPINVNRDSFPGDWSYDLVRYEGANGTGEETIVVQDKGENDTTFIDTVTPLDTRNSSYSYRVRFYHTPNTGPNANIKTFIDESQFASTVRLEPNSRTESIALNWSADVPWSNKETSFPLHYIYREFPLNSDVFELIDSVNVIQNGFSYVDDGSFMNQPLIKDTVYCYYVSTVGAYPPDLKLRDSLVNKSQKACVALLDTIKPCPLILDIDHVDCFNIQVIVGSIRVDCEAIEYPNILSWESAGGDNCEDEDIQGYKVYYSPVQTARENFILIAQVGKDSTSFTDDRLTGTKAGCYYVEVFDENEKNSNFSNIFCIENCPFYELPNSFSPNGDGRNDTFTPFNCPRFIKQVEFEVRSRWGDVVHTSNDDIYLNWDGTNKQGSDLPSGVYYYSAKVTYTTISGEEAVFSNLKGVIHLLRGKKND